MTRQETVQTIQMVLHHVAPDATVILYGSQARGDAHNDSDIDVLVLLNQEKVTLHDRRKVTYPLYEVEIETGIIISPKVFSRQQWESQLSITPFYHNVMKEGIVL